jgi:hypothetical protein
MDEQDDLLQPQVNPAEAWLQGKQTLDCYRGSNLLEERWMLFSLLLSCSQ